MSRVSSQRRQFGSDEARQDADFSDFGVKESWLSLLRPGAKHGLISVKETKQELERVGGDSVQTLLYRQVKPCELLGLIHPMVGSALWLMCQTRSAQPAA